MFRGINKTFLLDVYDGNLKHFALFIVEFKSQNCPSTTCALVACAIIRDISTFNERSVLLNNLLNNLCYLQALNSVTFILLLFTMFVFYVFMIVVNYFMYFIFLYCLCNWPFGCCVSKLIIKN